MYEIQSRSVDEHEAFSFEIERQNLKWLSDANKSFSEQMGQENALMDLHAHSHLKGKIFKRKVMDPGRLKGLGFFGLTGLLYAYFPYVACQLGAPLTTFAMTGSSFAGMLHLSETNTINAIEFLKEGEHAGKLKFTVSATLFKSKDLIVDANNAQGMISLSNDDVGEDGFESNLVHLSDFLDASTGQVVAGDSFVLPADGWKDLSVTDWILSVKGTGTTDADFNDYMMQAFDERAATEGPNAV